MIWIYKGKLSDTVVYRDLQEKLDDGWSLQKPNKDECKEIEEIKKLKIIADENGVKYKSNSTVKYIKGKLAEKGIVL